MPASTSLPPDLFDKATLVSLSATVAIVAFAYVTSRLTMSSKSSTALRFLFIWHLSDALCHFIIEGSFLYHCFFSFVQTKSRAARGMHPTPFNYLGYGKDRIYGPQANAENPFAALWMIYAKADKRWGGIDLGVVSLELLTVFVAGPLATYIAYLIAKGSNKASFWMIILATAELYGGFMTFCPEWLTGNVNLDGSNFMYLWVYLVFFNMLWVFIPLYAIYYAYQDISSAQALRVDKKKN